MNQSVSDAVAAAILSVLHDTGRDAKLIEPAMLLSSDLGLDSLDLAQTIVLLERSLGVDPFRSASGASIRTVADLSAIYSDAIASRRGTTPEELP